MTYKQHILTKKIAFLIQYRFVMQESFHITLHRCQLRSDIIPLSAENISLLFEGVYFALTNSTNRDRAYY
ncbi:MAG: hypothetical protein IKV79_05620 [Oscillospiraceae bacterium]|nr:hypothetical protein [Oscillospiraceae bacterium]